MNELFSLNYKFQYLNNPLMNSRYNVHNTSKRSLLKDSLTTRHQFLN